MYIGVYVHTRVHTRKGCLNLGNICLITYTNMYIPETFPQLQQMEEVAAVDEVCKISKLGKTCNQGTTDRSDPPQMKTTSYYQALLHNNNQPMGTSIHPPI